jgi:DNA-binding SARP family transcriptional activator
MVLAVLLASANRAVSQDSLIDAVWDGNPPSAARASLHAYVSNLRRVVGGDQIANAGHGYRLEGDETTVDSLQFEALAAQGHSNRTRDPTDSRTVLERALQLWRGSPYGELGTRPALVADVARLNELRLAVEEDRVEACLAMGDHDRVIGRLQVLVGEHPYRERFQAQLMLALYRSGRQADALWVFKESRRRLAEDLGIDPSDELWRLEESILRHDPALEAPALPVPSSRAPPRPISPSPVDAPTSSAKPRRRVLAPLFVAGVLIVGALIAFGDRALSRAQPLATGGCVAPPPMTAWWTGNDTTSDAIGQSHAQLMGGATFAAGVVNRSFALDGIRAYVAVPDDPVLDAGSGDFAVGLWVNFHSTAGVQILAEKWVQRDEETSSGWALSKMDDNSFGFFLEGGGERSPGVATSMIDIEPYTWMHVAARRQGDVIDIFVNGTLQAIYSGPDLGVDVDSDSSLKFGHRGGNQDTPGATKDQGFYLDGLIDEVHLTIGTALTPDEIQAIVKAGDNGLCARQSSA